MDNRVEQDALIEDALKSQPLAPMPRDIAASVLARIQVEERPALVAWNDFVIAFAIVLTTGALFITTQYLPPIVLAKLRIQGILLYQGLVVNSRWLIPALYFGLAALFAGLLIPPLLRIDIER